jgi:hypothetical protein
MQERIISRLKSVTLGAPQTHKSIAIFPITDGDGGAVNYITLTEALEGKFLTVSELSQGGSVPELKVTNNAETPVLLLDGEELAGAKQNRVLNTTVLAPEKQSIIIPVSCTEQGRWAYATETFYDSGTVMARSVRARKSQSVSESLECSASFRSDQGEVWNGISKLQEASGVPSPTAAMRDVFESHREPLDEAIKAFPLLPGQIGLLVVISGEAAGFDLVSRAAAYEHLHGKLIKSYVMDSLLGKKKVATDPAAATKAAHDFLERATRCEEKTFKSVGCGEDYRFKGDHMAGSALVHSETVIHTAFFHLDQTHAEGHMSGLNRRRSYRVD